MATKRGEDPLTTPATLRDVLDRLKGVQRAGEGYLAFCPSHDDGRRSLSVAEGDRGIVMNCHAGCEFNDLCREMQLDTKELFYEESKPVTIEYEYRDEDGKLVYVVERRTPKNFLQRRPDVNGGWLWNLKGVTHLPYRLPEFLAAPLDEPIFIVEGEKDVESLRSRGFFATCNSGGAGKWRKELSPYLKDRRVVIVPDNDDPGCEHAAKVSESVAGFAVDVRILELPNLPKKGDITDWFAAGHTADELRALITPAETPDTGEEFVATWLEEEPPPQRFVVDTIIPEGFPTNLFALGGSSKSFFALILAAHIAIGQSFLGLEVHGGGVLYIDGELDLKTFLRRSYMVARGMGYERPVPGVMYRRIRGSLLDRHNLDSIKAFIQSERPRMTIVDSFTALMPGEDTNSIDDVTKRMKPIEDLGTSLIIDHTSKGENGNATPIGSVAKMNFVRSGLHLLGSTDGAFVLQHKKSNFGKHHDPIGYELNFSTGMVILKEVSIADERLSSITEKQIPIKQQIRAAFEGGFFGSGATSQAIADRFEIPVKTARNRLRELVTRGVIFKEGDLWKTTVKPRWNPSFQEESHGPQ